MKLIYKFDQINIIELACMDLPNDESSLMDNLHSSIVLPYDMAVMLAPHPPKFKVPLIETTMLSIWKHSRPT